MIFSPIENFSKLLQSSDFLLKVVKFWFRTVELRFLCSWQILISIRRNSISSRQMSILSRRILISSDRILISTHLFTSFCWFLTYFNRISTISTDYFDISCAHANAWKGFIDDMQDWWHFHWQKWSNFFVQSFRKMQLRATSAKIS